MDVLCASLGHTANGTRYRKGGQIANHRNAPAPPDESASLAPGDCRTPATATEGRCSSTNKHQKSPPGKAGLPVQQEHPSGVIHRPQGPRYRPGPRPPARAAGACCRPAGATDGRRHTSVFLVRRPASATGPGQGLGPLRTRGTATLLGTTAQVTLYALRHTYGPAARDAGVPIGRARQSSGHKELGPDPRLLPRRGKNSVAGGAVDRSPPWSFDRARETRGPGRRPGALLDSEHDR